MSVTAKTSTPSGHAQVELTMDLEGLESTDALLEVLDLLELTLGACQTQVRAIRAGMTGTQQDIRHGAIIFPITPYTPKGD